MSDKKNAAPEAPVAAPQLSAEQFAQVLAVLGANKNNDSLTVDGLAEALAGLGPSIASAVAEASAKVASRQERYQTPEHEVAHTSFLNPVGERDLPRGVGELMFQDKNGEPREVWCRGTIKETDLDVNEIRRCNRIQEDKETRNGRVKARIGKGGATKTRLTISYDRSRDGRADLPDSFGTMLLELENGNARLDASTLMARVEELERLLNIRKDSVATVA